MSGGSQPEPSGSSRLPAYVERGVPVDLTDASGNTLVMLAAYHGRATTVMARLERGADPDRFNDRGQSPLAGAVFTGEDEVVHALVAAGADPDAGAPDCPGDGPDVRPDRPAARIARQHAGMA